MTEEDAIQALRDELRAIVKGTCADVPAAIRALINSTESGLEARLFVLAKPVGADGSVTWSPGVGALARSILVERDRDRDPAPFLEVPSTAHRRRGSRRWVSKPIFSEFHSEHNRLRRLDPVQEHTRTLATDERFTARLVAVVGLGDTREPAALDPLTSALADRSCVVRASAAHAVYRLRRSPAASLFATHPIHDALIGALNDRSRRVRIAAAIALHAYGDVEAIQRRRTRSWRDRRQLNLVLAGTFSAPSEQPNWQTQFPYDDHTEADHT